MKWTSVDTEVKTEKVLPDADEAFFCEDMTIGEQKEVLNSIDKMYNDAHHEAWHDHRIKEQENAFKELGGDY